MATPTQTPPRAAVSVRTRLAFVAAAVAIAAIAAVVLATRGGDGGRAVLGNPATIQIRDGQVVGGRARIDVRRGDAVTLTVVPDASVAGGGAHVHGYNLFAPFSGTQPVTFTFPATLEGVFEVEAHAPSRTVDLGKLNVSP